MNDGGTCKEKRGIQKWVTTESTKNNNFKINHHNYENAINVGFYQKGRKAKEIYADKH